MFYLVAGFIFISFLAFLFLLSVTREAELGEKELINLALKGNRRKRGRSRKK